MNPIARGGPFWTPITPQTGSFFHAESHYTHTSDQHSVYSTQAIACTPREAGYVLGGILDNDTDLAIAEHTSDTNGFTEHLFGLCVLLGISFLPRLKDLPDQVLSRIDRDADYGALQALLRLLSNAVLVWNTVHIASIVDQLRASGHDVKDADLARVSPLTHAHVIANGSYFQSPRRRTEIPPQPVIA